MRADISLAVPVVVPRAAGDGGLEHLAESGDSVPRWVSRKCNMLPKSALLRLWRGSRGSIRYAKALLASKGRETHAGSQGSIDSTFA